MLPRLFPLLLLAAALALPSAAAAKVIKLAPFPTADPGSLSPRTALRKAEAVSDGQRSARGTDLTPLLRKLAVALPGLSRSERARARKLLARPTKGDPNQSDNHYTVAEQAPLCSLHFCVHYVTSTNDAPPLADGNSNGVPDYVDTVSATFEHVYDVENTQLGWRKPKSDGARGCPASAADCMDRTDVYLQNIGDQALYGFAAADPDQQTFGQYAYLVLDNNFAEDVFSRYSSPLEPIEVTAAHEYNHVLQFGYDIEMNTWMFEASATWMENLVYPAINDYLQYMGSWAQLSFLPLTNEEGATDEFTGKTYGSMVWNEWIQHKFGADTVRKAWENALKTKPVRSFSPGAYDIAFKQKGSDFFKAFARFAADTAEWRSTNRAFPEGNLYPDVDRGRTVRGPIVHLKPNGSLVGAQLSHTGYGLVDVRPTKVPRIKLVVDIPRGPRMAVALVGRTGTASGGASTVVLKRLPSGGSGTVTLENPGQFTRITAVLINGDARTTARSPEDRFINGDWPWYADDVPMSAGISTDFKPPAISHRSPSSGKHGVSRRAPVKVTFSERLLHLGSHTASLRGPGGKKVKALVTVRSNRKLSIRPRASLRPRTRYTVRLGGSIMDPGGNRLSAASRTWTFTTTR